MILIDEAQVVALLVALNRLLNEVGWQKLHAFVRALQPVALIDVAQLTDRFRDRGLREGQGLAAIRNAIDLAQLRREARR